MRFSLTKIEFPGKLTKSGLTLPEGLSFNEWQKVGDTLGRLEGSISWAVGDWYNYGELAYGEKAPAARAIGEQGGLSEESVRAHAWVASQYETVTRVTNLSHTHHRIVAALDDRLEWLGRAEAEGWAVADLKAAVRESKHKEQFKTIAAEALDSGKYVVVLADPPWHYEFAETDSRKIENQYPTMDVEEIAALPVGDLLHEHAVLFLWATSPKLTEALRVMETWGFEYRTCAVWVKDQIGMGYYFRQQHELLLVGRRGELPVPAPGERASSVIEAPRTEHSAKPAEVYGLLEAMYPGFPKIELFAREKRDGWDSWGNEV